MVSASAFLFFDLLGPFADGLLGLLPKTLHRLLGPLLIFLDFVFVHRDRSAAQLFRVVRRQTEPTPVEPQAGDTDQEQNDHNH